MSKAICNLCGKEYSLFKHELGKHKIKYEESSSLHFRYVHGYPAICEWTGTDVYMYDICPTCAVKMLNFIKSLKVKE